MSDEQTGSLYHVIISDGTSEGRLAVEAESADDAADYALRRIDREFPGFGIKTIRRIREAILS